MSGNDELSDTFNNEVLFTVFLREVEFATAKSICENDKEAVLARIDSEEVDQFVKDLLRRATSNNGKGVFIGKIARFVTFSALFIFLL